MAKDIIPIQVRFPAELLDDLRMIAELEHRSLNAQIITFLELSVKDYKNKKEL